MGLKLNLVGSKFGKLIVERPAENLGLLTAWECRCSCGKLLKVRTKCLRSGKANGCRRCSQIRHGMTGTRVYKIWKSMMTRCFNPRSKNYKKYGAIGITVCDRWKKFENFYDDMGDPPDDNYTLDRLKNDQNYERKNCRWATERQQVWNRRKTKNTRSKYRGVYFNKGKWQVMINDGVKLIYIAQFDNEEEAARAWDKKAFELRGPDARLNFPEDKAETPLSESLALTRLSE